MVHLAKKKWDVDIKDRKAAGGTCTHLLEDGNCPIVIIWCACECYLAHEIFHAVAGTLLGCDILLTDNSTEEAYAHYYELVDSVVRESL